MLWSYWLIVEVLRLSRDWNFCLVEKLVQTEGRMENKLEIVL